MTINIKEKNFLDSQNVSYNIGYYFTEQFRYFFDITDAAQAWANGTADPDLGIIFKSTDEFEAGTTLHHRTFASYNRTGYQPTFIMTYTLKKGNVAEGSTKQLSTDMVGTVTWTSSNTSLATVDSTGKVTGVRAGQVTITASCPGYADVEFSIWVTIPYGVYYIKNVYSGYCLEGNTGRPRLYSQSTLETTQLNQLWKISYVSDGYYVIRPLSDFSVALTFDSSGYGAVVDANADDTALTSDFLWKITYNSNGYAFQLAGDSAQTMVPILLETTGSRVESHTWTYNDFCHWSLESVNGVFFRDQSTLQTITSSSVQCLALGKSLTIMQLDWKHEYYGSISDISWSTSDPSIVGISSIGTITGNAVGEATITVHVTLNGLSYSNSYTVAVRPSVVLYAVTASDHDHITNVNNVASMLSADLWGDILIRNGEFAAQTCKNDLLSHNIFISRSHGGISYSNTVPAAPMATYIVLNNNDEETDTGMIGLYSQASSNMNTSTSVALNSGEDYSNVHLAVFVGCCTAYCGNGGNNLPTRIVELGATTAIGFSEIITCEEATEWTNLFVKYMLDGLIVDYAVAQACNDLIDCPAIQSAVICGDGTLTIS